MDDRRIEEIRQAVLARLHGDPEERAVSSLEARVAALEAAVAQLRGAPTFPGRASGASQAHSHPSLVVLSLPPEAAAGEPGRCIMEPDKPCVQSGACRTFGH